MLAKQRTGIGRQSDILVDSQFVSWLRFALRHLYEPSVLQGSPLIGWLGLSTCLNPTSELRRVLAKEIRDMAPQADTPPGCELWRVYEILLYRYVQHNSEVQVADQLGISTRHLRREEHKAVEALAARLQRRICREEPTPGSEPQTRAGVRQADQEPATVDDEIAWLKRSEMQKLVNPTEALHSVLQLVRPLIERYNVKFDIISADEQLPLCVVRPAAFKQVLLSLLTVAIRVTERKLVRVSLQGGNVHVEFCIQSIGQRPGACSASENAANIGIARRLAESCGAQVITDDSVEDLVAIVTFPSIEQVSVLVIDDNLDTLRLLQRYATGTPYRVYGAQDLSGGLALVKEIQPRIIVLDVMMPDMDGWEILGQLRQHPLTCHIPIVVCTILPQQELALSLGATGFVGKPISRQDFLGALASLLPSSVPKLS